MNNDLSQENSGSLTSQQSSSQTSHSTLTDQLRSHSTESIIAVVLRILSPILFVVILLSLRLSDLWDGTLISKLSGLLLCILGSFFAKRMQKKAKSNLKATSSAVAERVLNEVLEDVVYLPQQTLPGEILGADMGFPFPVSYARGSDYVQATYKGKPVQFSDVQLIHEYETEGEDGHSRRVAETVFMGQWIVCQVPKLLGADVVISERRGLRGKLFSKASFRTGNEEFDQRFCVCSDCDQEALYLLSPHMMEDLTALDEYAGGNIYLHFTTEGTAYLAVHNKKDLFEPGGNAQTEQALHDRFLDQLQYILGLVDQMQIDEEQL